MHPDAQKRAQAEIDRVVGRERLPHFEDRDELVYVNALLKEVSRMYQVAPLGEYKLPCTPFAYSSPDPSALPHKSLEDDVYDGYFIPKGTLVIGNAW